MWTRRSAVRSLILPEIFSSRWPLGQYQSSSIDEVAVVWFGVNDVCSTHPGVIESGMKAIDMILDGCYSAGLRHVILVDVIPRIKPQSASASKSQFPPICTRIVPNERMY